MLTALAAPAQAAVKPTPSKLTAAQSQLLRTTLASRGVASASIDKALANPGVIPVGETSATTSGTTAPAAERGVVMTLIGTSCVGTSRWMSRTQYINNVFGAHLAWYTMKTTYCSTSTRITFANSTRTGGV